MFLLFAAAISAAGQLAKTASGRIQAASDLARLGAPGLRPWHMKMELTVFGEDGKSPRPGVIEVWHTDTKSLTRMTFGSSVTSHLQTEIGSYSEKSGEDISYLADVVLQAELQPGPTSKEISESKPELRKEGSGKDAYDCIMLSRPSTGAFAPLGFFPTYCLLLNSDRLAITYDYGSQTVVRVAIGHFQDHQVATKLSVQMGTVVVASAHVTVLSTFDPSPTQFEPTAEMKKAQIQMARVSGGVMAGNIVRKVPPVYPQSAKDRRVSGAVTLKAWIGKDGHIQSLQLMNAADPDLAVAAIAAVRQWSYKPYLLNGEPVDVETTIIVNFNLVSN